MATLLTYDTYGKREDLTDIIYNISPTDTPFMSGVGKTKATNTKYEWQTDSLGAVAANAKAEGASITYPTLTSTSRKHNNTQISTKAVQVSGTDDAMNLAGRNTELAYQVAKAAKELKRDMENALLSNTASAAGSSGSPTRTLGGVQTWISTNVSAGAGGSGAGSGAARTDGTQRVFTETLLKTVLRDCFDSGGNPNQIQLNAFNKQKLSMFTGGATRFDKAEDKRLITSIDVYESDFGTLQVQPNRFIRKSNATAAKRGQDVLCLEMDFWAVAFLRDFKLQTPGQSADADQRFLVAEYTLEAKNEAASGMVTDVTTS
jgi:hypothetical protein|tara:strand:- start:2617 stop:3570 length:954 start_codon:yes stop_codon:yes gene_type:complete